LKSDFTVVSFDFRGHGDHVHEAEGDLSWETLVEDTIEVYEQVIERYPTRSVIFIGHSMGGSIATKAVKKLIQRDGERSETEKRI
jgi:protein phosphatase methylesterase 1